MTTDTLITTIGKHLAASDLDGRAAFFTALEPIGERYGFTLKTDDAGRIALGDTFTDLPSGFRGKAVSRTTRLGGGMTIELQPPMYRDGERIAEDLPVSRWFSAGRLHLISKMPDREDGPKIRTDAT